MKVFGETAKIQQENNLIKSNPLDIARPLCYDASRQGKGVMSSDLSRLFFDFDKEASP